MGTKVDLASAVAKSGAAQSSRPGQKQMLPQSVIGELSTTMLARQKREFNELLRKKDVGTVCCHEIQTGEKTKAIGFTTFQWTRDVANRFMDKEAGDVANRFMDKEAGFTKPLPDTSDIAIKPSPSKEGTVTRSAVRVDQKALAGVIATRVDAKRKKTPVGISVTTAPMGIDPRLMKINPKTHKVAMGFRLPGDESRGRPLPPLPTKA